MPLEGTEKGFGGILGYGGQSCTAIRDVSITPINLAEEYRVPRAMKSKVYDLRDLNRAQYIDERETRWILLLSGVFFVMVPAVGELVENVGPAFDLVLRAILAALVMTGVYGCYLGAIYVPIADEMRIDSDRVTLLRERREVSVIEWGAASPSIVVQDTRVPRAASGNMASPTLANRSGIVWASPGRHVVDIPEEALADLKQAAREAGALVSEATVSAMGFKNVTQFTIRGPPSN